VGWCVVEYVGDGAVLSATRRARAKRQTGAKALESQRTVKYPNAIWRPCPKHGYGNDDTHLHEGICAHSMEGSLAAAFGELDNPNREASWTFSVAKNGDVYQHVDTDNIAWTNGSRNANKKFWGIEHEGIAGEPLTPAQEFATTALMEWLLSTYGLMPKRGVTLWEHNEMTAFGATPTACPSNRIPWNTIIPALEEDTMGMTSDERKLLDIIQGQVEQLITFHQPGPHGDTIDVDARNLLGILQGQVQQLLDAAETGAHTHEATVTLQ
jgi:hypothetical protein